MTGVTKTKKTKWNLLYNNIKIYKPTAFIFVNVKKKVSGTDNWILIKSPGS